MWFDYIYEDQSDSFSFYRIPKMLIADKEFAPLTVNAKLLYGLLLDRIGLSRINGWIDEAGHVYVYYSMTSVMKSMGCGKNKACKLLKELENFGLIERKKQGLGRPARIFVKNFSKVPKRGEDTIQNVDYGITEAVIMESAGQGSNNTEKNNTEISKTNLILSAGGVDNFGWDMDKDERTMYRKYLNDHLDVQLLYEKFPFDVELIDSIIELMLDTICSKSQYIRITGDSKPVNIVKSQFLKLDHMHIEYVISCLKENTTRIRNIRQYLMAALYNAPHTMQSYYQAQVNNDVLNGRV